jgi:hypothetical protein
VKQLNIQNRTSPCAAPFREVPIDIDGNMRRCCNMFVTAPTIANVMQTSIVDFFLSKEMTNLRRNLIFNGNNHYSPCDVCNVPDYASEYEAEAWNKKVKERFLHI